MNSNGIIVHVSRLFVCYEKQHQHHSVEGNLVCHSTRNHLMITPVLVADMRSSYSSVARLFSLLVHLGLHSLYSPLQHNCSDMVNVGHISSHHTPHSPALCLSCLFHILPIEGMKQHLQNLSGQPFLQSTSLFDI